MEEQDVKLICNAIETGKCLAFLGAGAGTSYRKNDREEEPGLPTGGELAEWLAQQCQFTNGSVYDLARVAEFFLYKYSGDREPLERALQEKLNIGCTPRPIHTVLAQLHQVKIVLTSNYDTLLENELTRYGRNLIRHVYNLNNPRAGHFQGTIFFGEKDLILHKMHGSIDEPNSIVITQSDYIRYLANLHDIDRGMPEYFRKTIIPQLTLLFLGYSLEDWNFRVIWEGVLSTHQIYGVQKISYAVVKHPSDFQKTFWFSRKVKILDGDLTEFAMRLAEHFNLEIPQLGINKSAGTVSKPKPRRIAMNRPIKILFLAANPKGTEPLRLGEEVREIDTALLKAKFRDKFEIDQQHAVRVGDLQEHLLRYQPDIVNFSGHGSEESEIILEDNTGESKPVSARALSNLFALLKDNIRCVVLNACYSAGQAQAIAEHIDCVVGMSKAIGDDSAIRFAAAFYQALGFGRDVKTAFDLGCNQIDLEGLDEQTTPKLLALHSKPEEIVFV
ncbi:MAG: SIR2 family protein [candidate division KSB1 bacterium]|nr:SIR2 family protein [candidate division KSB1 bacterium]